MGSGSAAAEHLTNPAKGKRPREMPTVVGDRSACAAGVILITFATSILRRHLLTLRNGRQTRTRALVFSTRECRCCELERGVLCEPHAASTPAAPPFCARCRSVHAACVACGGAGGVCEASNWVYERVRMCTDRKGGRGSGAYHPTGAVTPHTSLASVELLAPKQGYTR